MSRLNEINTENMHASTVIPNTIPKYNVNRLVLNQDTLIKQTDYIARDTTLRYATRQCWHRWSCLKFLYTIVPIIEWLPKYSIKKNIMGDILSGFTVGIVHIPHGIAYGILAGVSASNGLYMAIYPCLIYMLLGTSRHISIGTWAVASLMILKVVDSQPTYDSIEVVTTLTFAVGIILIVMWLLQLGIISALFSEPLVNGFTTGAACHVVSSQLKDIFGISIHHHTSAFKIIWTIYDVCRNLPQTNVATLIFGLTILAFMILCNEWIKPNLKKVCPLLLPAELIAVIGGTLVSMYLQVNERWNVQIIGIIPYGLPPPVLPNFVLIPKILPDSIAIALVTYSVIVSMGLYFGRAHDYQINANQELFAMGMANIFSGFFSCLPLACSMSRSLIQEQAGGSTQLITIVSVIVILLILFWASPFFRCLPRCVLAAIIIVALKAMFIQVKKLKKFSQNGKLELLQWFATFLTVVIIDIDYGLFIGLLISGINLFVKGFRPYACRLGFLQDIPAVYVDINNHHRAIEVPDTKIFRYFGSLNFATALTFRKTLYNTLEYKPSKDKTINPPFHFLIIDLSMLGHFDGAGVEMLSNIKHDLENKDIRMVLCNPSDRIYDRLIHSMLLGQGPFEIYPTLHDAVEYCNACRYALS